YPLAYIEWYTPFKHSDASTSLYQVSRSTRSRILHTEVISVDRIIGTCHLAAKARTTIDPSW
ncbi:hypothetical protein BDW22DRAFT_1309451, partial [Trametopsis cervina]